MAQPSIGLWVYTVPERDSPELSSRVRGTNQSCKFSDITVGDESHPLSSFFVYLQLVASGDDGCIHSLAWNIPAGFLFVQIDGPSGPGSSLSRRLSFHRKWKKQATHLSAFLHQLSLASPKQAGLELWLAVRAPGG